MICKLRTDIHDEYVPTTVTGFRMSRLSLPQRKFVIEFTIKQDSLGNDFTIQFNKTVGKTFGSYFDCNYTFTIDLAVCGISFGAKSTGKYNYNLNLV